MDYIRVTRENIENEHICCAISNNSDCQVIAKKSWLRDRFDDGLVFLRGNVRGKLFIEYIPAENAWAPVFADNYMYIDCFWISGQFKGQGYSSDLLSECIRDSREKGKSGLCVLSSQKKKMSFLSDPKYLLHKGFKVADTADPFFALMYLPFEDTAKTAPIPKFRDCVKNPGGNASAGSGQNADGDEDGDRYVIYYCDQCPYTAKYVPLVEECAKANGISLETVHITSAKQAQEAPTPFTAFSLFKNGAFVTNEILNEQRFLSLVNKNAN